MMLYIDANWKNTLKALMKW